MSRWAMVIPTLASSYTMLGHSNTHAWYQHASSKMIEFTKTCSSNTFGRQTRRTATSRLTCQNTKLHFLFLGKPLIRKRASALHDPGRAVATTANRSVRCAWYCYQRLLLIPCQFANTASLTCIGMATLADPIAFQLKSFLVSLGKSILK